MSPVKERLLHCEVCNSGKSKYTCPKCEVKTCSLGCVNKHKKELDCNGIRNKVAFKPISKMTNLDLLSDYRMLEEVTRSVELYKRDETKRYSRHYNNELPVHLFRLRAASVRRGIYLQYLPQHFTRHKTNTTYLNWSKQIIQWRVEWIFPHADNRKVINEKVLESEKLGLVLTRQLDSLLALDTFQWYQAVGINGVTLLLQVENMPKKYYQLDPAISLVDNLKGKVIIEFPRIYVIFIDQKANYDILDEDEEEAIEDENKRFLNKRPSHEGKNLLFDK